jgi:hypothetical protein
MIPAINKRPPKPPKKYPRLPVRAKLHGVTFFESGESVEETTHFFHSLEDDVAPDYCPDPAIHYILTVAEPLDQKFCAILNLQYLSHSLWLVRNRARLCP